MAGGRRQAASEHLHSTFEKQQMAPSGRKKTVASDVVDGTVLEHSVVSGMVGDGWDTAGSGNCMDAYG